MDIVEASEVFREEGNDFVFAYTSVILKQDDGYFHAIVNARNTDAAALDPATLDSIPIPAAHIRPAFEPSLTRAPDPLPEGCYVKR
jgi:hypothetical protein